MQATDILLAQGRYILIAGTLLVIMAIAPAAQATSLAPAIDSKPGQGSQADAPANPMLTRDTVKFLEDNWYFDYADRASQTEAEAKNPASTESSRDAFDFGAMERAPGLYTESADAASPAEDASVYVDLSHDEIKFLYNNWHLGPGIVIEDEVVDNAAAGNPALTRDRIQFLEDNWHFDTGALMHDEDMTDDQSEIRVITREEFQFNEDNWYYDTSEGSSQGEVNDSASGPTSGNNVDDADTLGELRNGAGAVDAGADQSHDALTYPWGGYLEHDY